MVKKNKETKKVDKGECTVRQFFYMNMRYEESLIGTLERTHHENKKTEKEWLEIMKLKKISF